MDIPEKLTIRVGDLRGPLAKFCSKNGVTPSEAIRQAIADLVGRKRPPTLRKGNPNFKAKGTK